jgi:hypothetical protein
MVPFDDDDFDFGELSDEEREEIERERKEQDERVNKHPLILQAQEILQIVDALLSSTDSETIEMYGGTLRESTRMLVVKLSSALRADSYVICMQSAAIIRDHAEYLRLSNHMLADSEAFDEKYITMFREEMEKFRELFKTWAIEIRDKENDFEDEWGLFLK